MKEIILYICRPISSEDLCYISWESDNRKASYGKGKTPICKINFNSISFHSKPYHSYLKFRSTLSLIMQIIKELNKHGQH